MGKKPEREKKPKGAEGDNLLKQLKKPLKKMVKLQGPEKTRELVQSLISSIETKLEVKAAKDKIEKEAKAAKKAIDKETREALAALEQPFSAVSDTEAKPQEETFQTTPEATTEESETLAAEASPSSAEVPQTEEVSKVPAQRRETKPRTDATPVNDQSEG
ncbi:hypothetical protein [Rufibacter tibetensis]|uniref:Uncharacterized protein n=1 Tax=Rufibacter tibetensis TaxID=512763 RepID=A0A0P0CK56_9BACT|nr:hypothetical protein [Rufibacter tibetensis]ALI99922.1 hypothetical protein DC20_14270 [Rufibacter tibetensis]